MDALQQMQRQIERFAMVEGILSLLVLIALIWGIVWSIGVVRRWERRQEAQLRALMRIAAKLSKEESRPSTPLGPMWSDTSRG